ncbi:alanine racemase [Acinetobacter nectaris]|uniref:alanine racemase n=1 Tax=Acinetobacter nectaris TaxID=1219382 RepID=UPI001F0295CC|nr:alanine racemase [Acinetobacter nectaris]MCF9046070.1 alanine racemase [Acinetobacter nectaris]
MPRPIQAIIHHHALTHNLNVARELTSPNSKLFAVVKANAYGHGIENIYSAFKNADGFALLDIDEAIRLRSLGWQGEILLLEGLFNETDLIACDTYNLSFTIHSLHQLKWLENYQGNAQFKVFLKMNSGMNRLGFKPQAYQIAWQALSKLSHVVDITHMMHFSDADGERLGQDGIEYQMIIFQETTKNMLGKCSLSNSAALLRHHTEIHSDYVRAGILLYGSSPDYPSHSADDWNLKPTMSLRSEIIAIQEINEKDSVGYGSQYIADHPMKIGVVACGYADGYQRISPSGTPILVNGQRTHLVGRVSMDMLAVDLTHIKDAKIGSEVVLWGVSSCGVTLSIDEVAATSNTLGYELMCAVTARVPFSVAKKSHV